MKAPMWTDQTVEEAVGELLRIGVLLAGAIVLAGGILYVIQYGGTLGNYASFDAHRAEWRGVVPVVKRAFGFDSRALIQLGLLLLIATPIARVAFSIIAFGLERDWTFVWITLVVFGILMLSLFGPIP
jgi:uncharacterized membrane protein